MTAVLSWTPVREGRTYCSPACGGDCTWLAYKNADFIAAGMVMALGEGWDPQVHENLGWHASAVKYRQGGCITVTAHGKRYTAYVGEHRGAGLWIGDGSTPVEAVRKAMAIGLEAVRKLQVILSAHQGIFAAIESPAPAKNEQCRCSEGCDHECTCGRRSSQGDSDVSLERTFREGGDRESRKMLNSLS
jgi:hypothetical protein